MALNGLSGLSGMSGMTGGKPVNTPGGSSGSGDGGPLSLQANVNAYEGDYEAGWVSGPPEGLQVGMLVNGDGIQSAPATVVSFDGSFVQITSRIGSDALNVVWTFTEA